MSKPPASPQERMLAAQRRARKRRLAGPRPAAEATSVPKQSPTQQAGARQEDLALAYLQAAGLRLLARNVACRAGELDLVMRDGSTLVFVEVRARRSRRFGGAAASVDGNKQRRLVRAAQHYLQHRWHGSLPCCRFDVVAVDDDEIEWVRDAFVASNG